MRRVRARPSRGILVAEPIVIDDYELVNCIATGNSTQVYEARQRSSGQTFAMKLLLEEAFKDAEQRKSLKHEATVGKSLEHRRGVLLLHRERLRAVLDGLLLQAVAQALHLLYAGFEQLLRGRQLFVALGQLVVAPGELVVSLRELFVALGELLRQRSDPGLVLASKQLELGDAALQRGHHRIAARGVVRFVLGDRGSRIARERWTIPL